MSQALKFSLAVAYSTVCAFHPAIAEDKSTITAQGVARGLGHHLRGKFTSAHEFIDGTDKGCDQDCTPCLQAVSRPHPLI
jgi:hypothetical protein